MPGPFLDNRLTDYPLTAHCVGLTCLVEQHPGTISTPGQHLKTVVLQPLGTDWPLFGFSDEDRLLPSERPPHQRFSILGLQIPGSRDSCSDYHRAIISVLAASIDQSIDRPFSRIRPSAYSLMPLDVIKR